MFALISIQSDKTLVSLFSHQCPEPVYDMQGQYLKINPSLDLQVIEMEG